MGVAIHVVAIEIASIDCLAVAANSQAGFRFDGILSLHGTDAQRQCQCNAFCNRYRFHSKHYYSITIAKFSICFSPPYHQLLGFLKSRIVINEDADFIVFCNFFTKNAIIFVVVSNFISIFVTK
jgi:hypothetical protein